MAWSGRNFQLTVLFLFGAVIAGLLMSEIEPAGLGVWLQGLLLWLSMYPFASSTGVPMRKYWFMLAVGLPLSVLLRNAGPLGPVLQIATLLLFAVALVVMLTRKLRTHD